MSTDSLIEVLLATYNGQSYLQEQIDSILNQTHQPTRILARDDGSSDESARILVNAAETHPDRVALLPGDKGSGHATWNFQILMSASTAPYVALADQDDVWLPGKLADSFAAMQKLEERYGKTVPLLVFTDLQVVDKDLGVIAPSLWQSQHLDPRRGRSLCLLLADNAVTGCTILMNRALVERASRMSSVAVLHDWWIALAACAFGHAYGLNQATMLYRQHAGNVTGAALQQPRTLLPKPRLHVHRRAHWERSVTMAKAFLSVYGAELEPAQRAVLQAFLRCDSKPNRLLRVSIWFRYRLFQKGLRENLAMLWYLWDMKAAKRTDAPVTAGL